MNEVTLSLERYNELYTFEMEVKNGGKIYSKRWWGGSPSDAYFTKDEVLTELSAANSELMERLQVEEHWRSDVEKKLWEYQSKYPEPPPVDLEQVKKMSIWQFIKWKKK